MPDFAKLLKPNPFAQDNGELDPALAAAFRTPTPVRTKTILHNLRRVLIAAFAHEMPKSEGDGKNTAHHLQSDPLANAKNLFRGEFFGGRKAIEIFSDLQSFSQVNRQARPVPIFARDIARIALSRGDGLIILNPHLPQIQYFGRSAVVALATQTTWTPPWEDENILREIQEEIQLLDRNLRQQLLRIETMPTAAGICILNLKIKQHTTPAQAAKLVHTISAAVRDRVYLRARLDTLEIRPILEICS